MKVGLATDCAATAHLSRTPASRPRPFVSATLLFPKRLLEDAVYCAVGRVRNGRVPRAGLEAACWIRRSGRHGTRLVPGSLDWCLHWLGIHAARHLFNEGNLGGIFPGRTALHAQMRALPEPLDVERVRAILLGFIKEQWAILRQPAVLTFPTPAMYESMPPCRLLPAHVEPVCLVECHGAGQ